MAFTQYSSKSSKKPIIIPISTRNGRKMNEPTVKGHVSLNPNDQKNGDFDVCVQLTLKNKDKRSQSLPRHCPEKRYDNNLKESAPKLSERRSKKDTSRESTYSSNSRLLWSERLGGNDSPAYPSSYVQILQAERDNLQKYVERPTKSSSDKKYKKKTQESVCLGDIASEPDDVSTLSALNPVRTLQFLLRELENIVQPKRDREQKVFKMIEDVINRIPNEFSPEIKKQQKELNTEPTSKPRRSEVSLSKYELIRKERDELHQKLDEKSKAHVVLERKLATAEAKITRLTSEVGELRDSNEKLIGDQKNLASFLKKQPSSKNLENHLENELVKAHSYIGGLETSCGKMKEKYTKKLRIIQEILNDGLDYHVKENPRISEVVGTSPLEMEPLVYPNDSIQAPASVAAKEKNKPDPQAQVLSTSTTSLNVQKYIDKVMMNSGLLKPDQEHLFQSFHSIADHE